MKKMYVKPEVMFEDFSSSTSIATCDVKSGGPSKDNCPYKWSFGPNKQYNIFYSTMTGICGTYEVSDLMGDDPDDGVYNGVCYHTSANGLFAS